MSNEEKHDLKREFGGEAEMGWIKPTCSCGWKGIKYHAYNDYMHAMVRDQETEHFAQVRKLSVKS